MLAGVAHIHSHDTKARASSTKSRAVLLLEPADLGKEGEIALHAEPVPEKGRNFQGDWWQGKTDAKGKPVPISNPNARITYSGRDSDTMPPVWVAKSPDHGVAIGASILSAAAATEVGAKGVNQQPWANSPFIPCPLGDYMAAQFLFFNSKKFSTAGRPLIAGLNYFLLDSERGGG